MTNRALELEYDPEATLRLVNPEFEERGGPTDDAPAASRAATPADVERVAEEIARLVEGLHACRAHVETAAATGLRAPAGPRGDEVDLVAVQLRLQAVTRQQLAHAASMLAELEARLAVVAHLLAPRRGTAS